MADEDITATRWWLAVIGDLMVWSRLRAFADGHAEIFAADGRTMRFETAERARAALLDADFLALDGLDDDDANQLGFDLASTAPPMADSDEDLLPLMTEKRTGHT